jgi:hypothetical protein
MRKLIGLVLQSTIVYAAVIMVRLMDSQWPELPKHQLEVDTLTSASCANSSIRSLETSARALTPRGVFTSEASYEEPRL